MITPLPSHCDRWLQAAASLCLCLFALAGFGQSLPASAPPTSAVAVGDYYTLALRPDGSLWSWGVNICGGLGRPDNMGTFLPNPTPAPVATPPTAAADTHWTHLAAAGATSLALRSDGTLWRWGLDCGSQVQNNTAMPTPVFLPPGLPEGTIWAGVSTSGLHNLAWCSDGSLWAWGYNAAGQLGNGQLTTTNQPQRVAAPALGHRWVAAWAGASHSLGLRDDGSLWAWGSNSCGALGVPVTTSAPLYAVLRPVLVPTPTGAAPGTHWVAAVPDQAHSLAIRSDGTLWVWGNYHGRMPDATQIKQPANLSWRQVSSYNYSTLAVSADGAIWSWGPFNERGILGTNSTAVIYQPQQEATRERWLQVAVGTEHAAALRLTTGEACATGAYYPPNAPNINYGQLGDGTLNGSLVFKPSQAQVLSTSSASAARFTLFPNPAGAFVQVSGLRSHSQLTLRAADGRVVRSYLVGSVGSSPQWLDLQNVAAGLYLLSIQAPQEPVRIARLLIQ